jgi:predicted molibdopterin-dependent oxidoreductase YjgC
VLPAAGWGEKEGTFINSERRIGLVKRVRRAPGLALADFEIFRLVAQAWGVGELFAAWRSPEAVFRILQRLSAGQPCDIGGIAGYAALDALGGVQWPWPAGAGAEPPVERRLFEDGRFHHADGRARFIFDRPRRTPEIPDAEFPFWLLTGRGSASQWHTETRTSKSALLRSLHPAEAYVEIHPADADARDVQSGMLVSVESRRASVPARAFVTATVERGQVFMPMHYSVTNRLTDPVFDPHSRQPSYKACAVNVRFPKAWEAPR